MLSLVISWFILKVLLASCVEVFYFLSLCCFLTFKIVLVYLSLIGPRVFFSTSNCWVIVCVTKAHFPLLPPAGLESCIWVPFADLDRKRPHTSYRLVAERWRNVWSGGSYTGILTVINKYSGEQQRRASGDLISVSGSYESWSPICCEIWRRCRDGKIIYRERSVLEFAVWKIHVCSTTLQGGYKLVLNSPVMLLWRWMQT